jgi:cobyrinic acid a,c-diamide synthase
VQPFKVGPDYIDPAFHSRACGRPSRNLDAWLVPPPKLEALFLRHAPRDGGSPADPVTALSLIEGVMGLYDGAGRTAFAGTAHIAALLKAPVVLILNASGLALSAAAMLLGYASFRPRRAEGAPKLDDLRVGGVILNRVSGPGHYALLKDCLEEQTGLPCLGYLPKNAAPPLPERHLGLVPPEESRDLDDYFRQLADLADAFLDIPALLHLAGTAPTLDNCVKPEPPELVIQSLSPSIKTGSAKNPSSCLSRTGKQLPPLRIGLPRDAAFSFYYQDALDLLEAAGARLIPFSPLADARLPEDLDGLYLGGGFPEMFAPELAANAALRGELLAALRRGLPAYAECGGMLYLCAGLRCLDANKEPGDSWPMVGFFPQSAVMTPRLQPFGYVTVTAARDCLLGPKGTRWRAHEFHYARLEQEPKAPALLMEKPDGRRWTGGLCDGNVLAAFPHLHFCGCPQTAAAFLRCCADYRTERTTA